MGIAQLAEHRTVAPTVAGSIPVSHPRFFRYCVIRDATRDDALCRGCGSVNANSTASPRKLFDTYFAAECSHAGSILGMHGCREAFFLADLLTRLLRWTRIRTNLSRGPRLPPTGLVAIDGPRQIYDPRAPWQFQLQEELHEEFSTQAG